MKLVNWKSNNNVFDIFDNFDRYFNNIVQDNYRYAAPSVNISDNDKKYSLSLDMPGVNKKDIEIEGGVVYTGNPQVLKKICPGVYGTIKPIGICMIGARWKNL